VNGCEVIAVTARLRPTNGGVHEGRTVWSPARTASHEIAVVDSAQREPRRRNAVRRAVCAWDAHACAAAALLARKSNEAHKAAMTGWCALHHEHLPWRGNHGVESVSQAERSLTHGCFVVHCMWYVARRTLHVIYVAYLTHGLAECT